MRSSDEPRKLVIVAGDFVETGGMDRANFALADYLARAGRRVELVAHRVLPELAARHGVAFRRVPKPLGSYMLGEPFLDALGRRAVEQARARGELTLVNGGNVAAVAANWVHYVHAAYEPVERGAVRSARRWVFHRQALRRERQALGLATSVIANSEATKRVLVERVGVREERVKVIYYGIDATRFSAIDPTNTAEARRRLGFSDRPLVAFVGSLGDRRKGFDTLFEAWQALCRQPSWDAELVVVGAGGELASFRERSRALGLGERVRLLGFRRDVDAVLGACDALVSPTRYEAFGLGVAEALARGLPALVSAGAGVAELYPAALRDLLLEEPESAGELGRKLLVWRENLAGQRSRMSELSARVRSRSWDDMAADITAHLDATGP